MHFHAEIMLNNIAINNFIANVGQRAQRTLSLSLYLSIIFVSCRESLDHLSATLMLNPELPDFLKGKRVTFHREKVVSALLPDTLPDRDLG